MTNSTRLIGLIMMIALCVSRAAGQELPLPDLEAAPPDLTLPSMDSGASPVLTPPGTDDRSVLTGPDSREAVPFDGYQPEGHGDISPEMHGLWYGPTAPIESTGTWLRRGFWYAEAEAVVWNRLWNRDSVFYAAQDPQVLDPQFFNQFRPIFNTNRLLVLQGAQPGEDASVRATLGQFLFRDSKNRDHTAEFTVLGGGDWHQHRTIASENNFGLFVPFIIDGGNRSFSGSTSQQLDYSSHYSSFEGNYRVKQRMRRDQMVMDANGHWHRAANPGFVREALVGLRFMEMRDIMDWRAQDIVALGDDGAYLIRTDNDMFGFQLGAGLTFEHSRWSLGAHTKGGVFVNDAVGRTTLDFTSDDDDDADLRLAEHELSFIGEFKLLGRWHILPNFSLRAAYEMMYVTSVAMAPYQATFITEFSYLNTTGDPFYHGASFGFEGFW